MAGRAHRPRLRGVWTGDHAPRPCGSTRDPATVTTQLPGALTSGGDRRPAAFAAESLDARGDDRQEAASEAPPAYGQTHGPARLFLIGHQREWPEALAYRLALDLATEDIASFRLPAKLSIRMSALEDHDRVRDSLYKRLAGKLQGAGDESLALVERLRFRLTEEKDPLVFFVKLPADEEPKDIAAALTVLLRAWEELLAPIAPPSRHYLVLTLDVVQERPRWFSFWRARDTFERFARACSEVLEAAEFADLSLPDLRSPMRRDVEAWLEECVESFHPSRAEEVRTDAMALFEARDKIPHYELKRRIAPHLDRLSSLTT